MSNLMNVPNKNFPTIAGVEIHTDENGRFNLNALHKASGGKDAKRPKTWLETKQAQELIEELRQNSALAQEVIKVQKGGINPGTFAHELLAIEYAGWISPKFRLMVNQIFIDYRMGKLTPIDPTNLGLPNFLDPAESAIAWAAQHKKVQLLGVQVQQLETENDCLKNLFKEGMTPTQFSKMLNGVNSQQINHYLAEIKWLYNESKSGNNLRWRVAATARDKYLTEKQNEISPHGANSFISYRPVLLRKGAQRLYDQYLSDKLPMKKNWNGLHTHDKTIQIVA